MKRNNVISISIIILPLIAVWAYITSPFTPPDPPLSQRELLIQSVEDQLLYPHGSVDDVSEFVGEDGERYFEIEVTTLDSHPGRKDKRVYGVLITDSAGNVVDHPNPNVYGIWKRRPGFERTVKESDPNALVHVHIGLKKTSDCFDDPFVCRDLEKEKTLSDLQVLFKQTGIEQDLRGPVIRSVESAYERKSRTFDLFLSYTHIVALEQHVHMVDYVYEVTVGRGAVTFSNG